MPFFCAIRSGSCRMSSASSLAGNSKDREYSCTRVRTECHFRYHPGKKLLGCGHPFLDFRRCLLDNGRCEYLIEIIFRLAGKHINIDDFDVWPNDIGHDFLHQRRLSPSTRRNEDGIDAMGQISLQVLCVLGSIREITTFNSLTEYKRILFHAYRFLEIRHKDTKKKQSNKTFSKKVVTKCSVTWCYKKTACPLPASPISIKECFLSAHSSCSQRHVQGDNAPPDE